MFSKYKIIHRNSADHPLIKNFIKKHHYLKKISYGNKHVFCLGIGNKLVGVAIYGEPVGTKCVSKYGRVIELKRLALSPRCQKNTASWFMAKCHKLLPKGISVLSYADPSQGHEGTIYKASNFKYLGTQKYATPYIKVVGTSKLYPARVMYQVIKGKPTKTNIMLKKKQKLGLTKTVYPQKKHIFLYKR